MTRHEAIEKILANSWTVANPNAFVDALVSLGLLTLDAPIDRRKLNAVDEALSLVRTYDLPCASTTFIRRLESNGYKIVEKGRD